MELYTWDSSFSMGDAELDKHHRVLIGLINDLYTAMMDGDGARASQAIYQRLREYTRFHFEAEEREMYQARYPEYGRHHEQHEGFTRHLDALAEEFGKKDGAPGSKMLGMMRNWLRTHIRSADVQYAEWLAAHPDLAALHAHSAGQEPPQASPGVE
ncbi:MAG: bacteriohemerythrin [Acidobacteriota bacterium]|nr:bacteriohemerythrin [Acidobacteriota bacterium]